MDIEAFTWSDSFATGIESIDTQHQRLFQIINQVGNLLARSEAMAEVELQDVFKQLIDYARFHFSDEERVMTEGALEAQRIERHKQHHHNFLEQVMAMWQSRANMSRPVETLHGFLSSWLTYHILGEDQMMVREIVRIREGMAPAAAYEAESLHHERATSALLDALHKLYGVLLQQNRDLDQANRALEARVAERTEEIKTAYAKLSAEHQALSELLVKVEQTQSQLMQSEKMAAIGQLAAGVAHEINNPVGFVNSNLGTLGRYVKDLLRLADAAVESPSGQAVAKEVDLPFLREDVAALLTESREGLERVSRIVANLKDFSHVDEADWQEADLIAGLESTINVVWHEIKYKVEIMRELQPLPLVRCIPAQINQVLMNLLLNAAQAIPYRGTLTLKSGQENEQVWIEVADSGEGMTEDTLSRLFEPFFTTKPVGQGTGLGLSLSYDIINKHGGSFDVESSPGNGSRIRFWLPIAGPTAAPGCN